MSCDFKTTCMQIQNTDHVISKQTACIFKIILIYFQNIMLANSKYLSCKFKIIRLQIQNKEVFLLCFLSVLNE